MVQTLRDPDHSWDKFSSHAGPCHFGLKPSNVKEKRKKVTTN